MSVNAIENVNILCKKCSHFITIDKNNLIHKTYDEERSLGYETEHIFNLVDQCSKCNNDIIIKYIVYEYPTSMINTILDESSGIYTLSKLNTVFESSEDKFSETKSEETEPNHNTEIGEWLVWYMLKYKCDIVVASEKLIEKTCSGKKQN